MDLRRGTMMIFGGTILRNLLSFAAIAYFSRSVGIGALGSFFLFQSILSLIAIPADFGIRIGVEKRLSEGQPPGPILGSALVFKFALLAIFSIGILLLRGIIADYTGADIAPLLIVGVILNEAGQLGNHTLRGEMRVSETAFFQPLRTAIWAIFGVVLVQFGVGQNSLIYSYTIGLLIVTITVVWRVDSPVGHPSIAHLRSLFSYSKFAAIGSAGSIVYNWADVLFIGFFLSQAAVGAYEVAWRVATASLLLSTAVRTSVFPQANQWGADGEYDRLESLIEGALLPSLYFVIPIFVGVLILGDHILSVAFAVEFPGIMLVLVILMLEKVQRAIILVLIPPLHAIGGVDIDVYTTIVGVVVNLVLNVLLIPRYGIVGAAIGTSVGAATKTTIHTFVLSRNLDLRVPIRPLAWCVFAACLMGVVIFGLQPYFALQTVTGLAAAISIAAVIYGTTTIVSPRIRQRAFEFVPI